MTRLRPNPNDPVLPQLGQLLDEAAMRTWFAYHLVSGSDCRVERCRVERAKYRPGRSAVIGYALDLRHAHTGLTRTQRVCAAVYAGQEAAQRAQACAQKSYAPVEAVKPFVYGADLALLAWAFPNDRKLNALPLIADPAAMRAALSARSAAAPWGMRAHAEAIGHEIVSYFPEHTCTARLSVNASDGNGQPSRVYVKTRYDDAGARTRRTMDALTASAAAQSGEVGYARALAYDAASRMLWQEGVAAPTLHACLEQQRVSELRRVGAALAALHTTAIADRTNTSVLQPGGGAVRLRAAQATLAGARPELAFRLQRCVQRLLAEAPDADSGRALIHGDLHSKNILISSARVFFIDMDRTGYGSALAELGALIAELHHRALQQKIDLDEHIDALRAAYVERVPWRIAPRTLAWHVAVALISERALRCLTSLKPGADEDIEHLIAAAEATAHEHNTGRVSYARPAEVV